MARATAAAETFAALTGLRFVAAAMILLHHARGIGIPVPGWALDRGVSFFFVLSGFVLAHVYPRLAGRDDIRAFLVARVARIWPAYLVALVFAIVALGQPINTTFPANLLMVQAWVPMMPWYFGYNGPSWSVSTEYFFYLVFPLLILGWARSWWWKWAAAALLVVALVLLATALCLPPVAPGFEPTMHGLLYVNPLARLFEFVTGMIAYGAFTRLRPLAGRLGTAGFTLMEASLVGLVAASLVTLAPVPQLAPLLPAAGREWLSHAGGVVLFPFVTILFAFGRGWLSRWLASRPMVGLGQISYSVYLLHATVYALYRTHFGAAAGPPDYAGFAACLAVTLALAFLVFNFVEEPCRQRARQWLRRSAPKPA